MRATKKGRRNITKNTKSKKKRNTSKREKEKNLKNAEKKENRGKRIKEKKKGGEGLRHDMYLNFNKQVYTFIDNNKVLFDLDDITKDHSIDMDCLTKYIAHQGNNHKSKPFWNFYEYLYKNIIYISNSKITEQYENNAKEIHDLYTNKSINILDCHLVLILTEEVDKSNYYFTLYFLYLYKKLYPNDYQHIEVILETEMKIGTKNRYPGEDRINFQYYSNHTIYIMTDDFCYSGEQMNTEINTHVQKNNYPHLTHAQNKNKNFSVYINVVGMTSIALKLLNNNHKIKLYIPQQCIIINNATYNDIFDKYCKEYNYTIQSEAVDMFCFTKDNINPRSFNEELKIDKNMPLIYLSFKYPDYISIAPYLCYFGESSEIYFIAHSDYTEENMNSFHKEMRENDTGRTFHEKCSSLKFIFQLNDLESFKEKYPELVHTIDKNEPGSNMLKLMKNCNYEAIVTYEKRRAPRCNFFCYKPFYKKSQNKNKMNSLLDKLKQLMNQVI